MRLFTLAFSLFALLQGSVSSAKIQKILFLGDSLTSGYGVNKNEDYPSLLGQILKKKGHDIEVINGAEGGSLSSSVLSRLEFHLKKTKPDIVVVATGGNDARQATPPHQIESNIRQVIKKARAENIQVLLIGMKIFPNLGPQYANEFAKIYPELAQSEKVPLVPFPLEKIAGQVQYQQEDGFHPNAQGHQWMAQKILPFLEKLL